MPTRTLGKSVCNKVMFCHFRQLLCIPQLCLLLRQCCFETKETMQERQPKSFLHFPSPGSLAAGLPWALWQGRCLRWGGTNGVTQPEMLLSLCEHPVGAAEGAEPGSSGLGPWEGGRKRWHQVAPEQQPEGARCGSGPLGLHWRMRAQGRADSWTSSGSCQALF